MWTDAARRAAGRDLEWEPDGKRANDMLCRGMTSTDLLVQANGRAFVRLFRDRAKELCGWDASRDGVRFSPYIARKLVDEALRTGRWQELPDYLQGEYHELAGDGISWAGDWMTDEVRAEALAIYGKDRYG